MKQATQSNLLAPWTEAQRALWERWGAAVEHGESPVASLAALWALPLEFWKAAIFETLDMQLAAAETWKAWVCATDANIPEITLGACQTLHFAEDWARAQMQLWEGWFAALERLLPGAAPATAHSRRADDRTGPGRAA